VQVAVVYMPKETVYYRAVKSGDKATVWRPEAWQLDVSPAMPTASMPNAIGIVPVVPFINRRDVSPMGFGEFEDVVDVQDRINTTVLDRLVIQAMQAFRQRYAIGLDLVDEKGNPTKAFDPGADLIWSIPNDGDGNQGVKFGDFEQSDLDPIIKATESDVAVMGNLSRTPPHYLTGQLVNVSGDALTVAESGLVSKIRATQTEFGEDWERVQFIAAKYDGREIGQDSVIAWTDPERRSLASLADAAVKYQNAGVPFRPRMALLGFTPSEIDRMEQERVKDSLLASLNSPLSVDPGASAATVNVAQAAPGSPAPAVPPQPANA
jgi:hypothetical protein